MSKLWALFSSGDNSLTDSFSISLLPKAWQTRGVRSAQGPVRFLGST